MSAGGLSKGRLGRMHDVMARHVERGGVPGAVTAVCRRGEAHVDAIGTTTVPNGARRMWGMGSSVTCPPWYAVGSPSRNAAHACAAS